MFDKISFKEIDHNGITYLIKRNIDATKPPCVFIHGLGFGPYPYFKFIMELIEDRTVICPVYPNFSYDQSSNKNNLDFFNLKDNLNKFIKKMGIEKYDLVGHSYGTILSAYFMENNDKINQIVLIDPIVFLTRYTKINKIAYFSIQKAWHKTRFIDSLAVRIRKLLIHIMIFKDHKFELLLKRNTINFSYFTYLFDDKYINKLKILLSEYDVYVPSVQIKKYLDEKHPDVSLYYAYGHGHGSFLHGQPKYTVKYIDK
jgi:pimeloyl-ACP methyl ester carboxylesterase